MSRCIDEAQRSLGFIGISGSNITRLSNKELHVFRQPPSGNSYELFIWLDKADTIVFQSIVFKGVYGSAEKELGFYQVLLYYNNYINFASFGIARSDKPKEWDVILTSNQICGNINPKTVTQVIRTFDYAYLEILPQLKQKANEWRLDFTGKIRGDFDKLLGE